VSVDIRFGALEKPIIEQLRKQHVLLPPTRMTSLGHIQTDADSITRLAVRGYIPNGQKRDLHKKLMKRLTKLLEETR
jgi:hypothetical protein